MRATNAVMEVDEDLGGGRKPEVSGRGGIRNLIVGRVEEAMGEDFGDPLEGSIRYGTLRGVGKVRKEDGFGDGDGMRGGEAFGDSDGELAEGNRDRGRGGAGTLGIKVSIKDGGGGESGRGVRGLENDDNSGKGSGTESKRCISTFREQTTSSKSREIPVVQRICKRVS